MVRNELTQAPLFPVAEVPLSPVADLLETSAQRIAGRVSAARLWERVLSEAERLRLGGDLLSLWCQLGTAGIWQKLRGVSRDRAVVDVASELGLLDPSTTRWLLRELGEVSDDPEEAIAAARKSTALVLVERPRAVYWNGQPIAVDWERYTALWQFFWALCQQAKAGQPLDALDLGESAHADSVTKQKSRLRGTAGFPFALGNLIKPTGRRTHKLDLPPHAIRIFEVVATDRVREWTP